MLFSVIGGIAFLIALSMQEKNVRENEIKKAEEEGYEVYFAN